MKTEKPVFVQIVEMVEDDILSGVYQTDEMIISTTQISKLLKVNPTTAVKAVGILASRGIVYKKRGLGMAVSPEAKALILAQRKEQFYTQALPEFMDDAEKIGITKQELAQMITGGTP